MASAAFSTARLSRMHDVMAGHVEQGHVPGLVALVGRHDEIHVDTIGTTAVGGNEPMRRDTIFRITSMTKPVTAVAAMILVEECVLRLDDPVDRWLPELADRRVLRRLDGPLDDTEPARRPITLRDLLTLRLGLGMIMQPSSTFPIQQAMNALQIVGFGPPDPSTPHAPDEWMRRVGTLPLMYQPGERWMYNLGSYVLGVLIARASGMPLETFLHERIFAPLGMTDTAFSVPAGKLDRFLPAYWPEPKTGGVTQHDGVADSRWARPPAFPDAGAGLVSTIDDFAAFGRMLLANGAHGGERILSRAAVATMTTDHLTPAQKAAADFAGFFDDHGWGFGLSIVTRRDGLAGTPGRFGWDGGFGTAWASDPGEDMIGILMTQVAGFSTFSPVHLDFWTSAYQAIAD